MVSSLAVLCLVAGLLEGAFSLTCYHCESTEKDCTTGERICDKTSDMCIANITDITTQSKTVKRIVRACGVKDMCNTTYSMTLGNTSLQAVTQCCNKDKCPITNFNVPKNPNENQVECSTCNEANTEKCKNTVKIRCTGDEKKCATYTARDSKSIKYASQACVTENVCTMQNVSTLPFGQVLMTKFDCTNHAPSALPGLLFPVAILIAMLKLLS